MVTYDETRMDFENEWATSHCDEIIKNQKPIYITYSAAFLQRSNEAVMI